MAPVTRFKPDMDFRLAASLEMLKGVRTENVFGIRDDITLAGEEDIINFGPGGDYVFPSDTGETLQAVSADAGDVGVEYVIDGLDENGFRRFERITLNGTTPVQTAGLFSRVNFFFNDGATPSAGVVSLQNLAGTVTYAAASVSGQQHNGGVYSVARDENASVISVTPTIRKSGGSNTGASVGLKFRLRGKVFRGPAGLGLQRQGSTVTVLENIVPDTLPPLTDIKIQGGADGAGTTVAARVGMILTKTDPQPPVGG